jgi:hypothetical protein
MGDGDKHARQTARFDSRKLAELTKQHVPAETGSDDHGVPGTPKPGPLAMPRTTTLDDPFTTSLLAEVARRSKTIEVSPAQVDEAMNRDPGDPDDPDPSEDPT